MSEKSLARIAGALYLVVAVGGIFAEIVRQVIVETGDPAATADNIRSSAGLFRAGFAADLLQATFFLFTAMALYLLLRHVDELVARAMVVLVAVSVAIMSLNLLNQWIALRVATGQQPGFGPQGADALTGLFADMHHFGSLIAQMFFGLWLLPLGALVVRSGWFPRVLGILLMAGAMSYVVDLFGRFLAPGVAEAIGPYLLAPAAIGELAFVGWLLVKAVPAEEQVTRIPALAA